MLFVFLVDMLVPIRQALGCPLQTMDILIALVSAWMVALLLWIVQLELSNKYE
ncbi:hypothetical protein [Pseudoalteromonas sp. T1lg76]|uniref:hypothetical protein n=1 Tax=Pseudoalteromonas sp. T1lg76 TaxID=2077103 RepID=UPI00131A1A64|nr:hypothetical protein [Pseudoalteromonas sp. T1lg76]